MFLLQVNTKAFEQRAEEIGGAIDQLPYVYAGILNDAAFKTRTVLTEVTWPKSVNARNARFISAALRVQPATKAVPIVTIYDQLGRGNLLQHARGGTSFPMKAKVLAVPMPGRARRTASGVYQIDKPASLIASLPKKVLRITSRGLFVAVGGRLRLFYAFVKSVSIKPTVPFIEDFRYTMTESMRTGFDDKMAKAMATRRKV